MYARTLIAHVRKILRVARYERFGRQALDGWPIPIACLHRGAVEHRHGAIGGLVSIPGRNAYWDALTMASIGARCNPDPD